MMLEYRVDKSGTPTICPTNTLDIPVCGLQPVPLFVCLFFFFFVFFFAHSIYALMLVYIDYTQLTIREYGLSILSLSHKLASYTAQLMFSFDET